MSRSRAARSGEVYAEGSLRVNRSAIGGVPRSMASKIWWMRLTLGCVLHWRFIPAVVVRILCATIGSFSTAIARASG